MCCLSTLRCLDQWRSLSQFSACDPCTREDQQKLNYSLERQLRFEDFKQELNRYVALLRDSHAHLFFLVLVSLDLFFLDSSFFPCFCLSVFLYLLCPLSYLYFCLPVCRSSFLPSFLSSFLISFLSVCLSACLSVCLSVFLCVCLIACLSFSLFFRLSFFLSSFFTSFFSVFFPYSLSFFLSFILCSSPPPPPAYVI